MRNSFLPPPPPPPATTAKSRFQTCKNANQGLLKMPVSNCLPPRDKRTRDLPNMSDCHGCGVRINFSNPKERLHPLGSFWRVVLLCKKCIKMVNSGQLCSYCFGNNVNLDSDCVKCNHCERYIHQNCVVKYSGSPPWSYSCKESGSGFSVCVDCWVPKSLKNSARVCRRKEVPEKSGKELSANQCDSRVSMKGNDGVKSIEEVVKDANLVVEKKIAVAVKAKETALRKAVVAKNAVMLASNALNLVAKEGSKKKSEGLVASMNNAGTEATRFVDDAELAFQLHRAMNSSPRISKNTCSTNLRHSDRLKLTDSCSVSPKLNDLGSGDDGKVAVCSNTLTKGNHDSNIMEASACIRMNGSCSAISSHRLKPELKTFERRNKKRKDFQENAENGSVGTSFGVAGKGTIGDGGKIVTEPQSCQFSNTLTKGSHDNDDGNIKEASACIMTYGSFAALNLRRFKPELKTYERRNKKRNDFQENVENSYVGTSFGVSGECTAGDGGKIATEPQSCQLDELKQVFQGNDARTSSPESCYTNILTENMSGNRRPERYLKKFKRMTGRRMGSYEEFKFRHEESNLDSSSFQKETHASASGLPMDCSIDCRALSDSSLHSCVVNLQAYASIGVSSQEEG